MYWIQSEDSLRIGFKAKNRRLCPVGLFSHVYKRFHTSLHHVTHAVFIAIVDPSRLINPGINGLQLQINLPKLRRCALFVCAEGALCKRSMISPHTWPWSSDARVCVAGNIQLSLRQPWVKARCMVIHRHVTHVTESIPVQRGNVRARTTNVRSSNVLYVLYVREKYANVTNLKRTFF